VNHLTDDQIQEYLDNIDVRENQAIEVHLSECHNCRERLENYRSLYDGLKLDPVPPLPAGFAREMAKAVAGQAEVNSSRRAWQWILAVAGGIFSMAALVYYVNLGGLIEVLNLSKLFDFKFISEYANILSSKGISPIFVVLVGLVLIITGAIDYIIQNSRQKTTTFMV